MINYQHIADTQKFWHGKGFANIETPWTVTPQISNITKPPAAKDFKLIHDDDKVLVASGEQGFLYLYNKGFLPLARFQTTTPCFRKESFGEFHTKYFIKTELIDTKAVTEGNLSDIVSLAFENFATLYEGNKNKLSLVDTSYQLGYPSFDIELGGIEIGSYGIRSCSFLEWVYGTAIAEPRFSKAKRAVA